MSKLSGVANDITIKSFCCVWFRLNVASTWKCLETSQTTNIFEKQTILNSFLHWLKVEHVYRHQIRSALFAVITIFMELTDKVILFKLPFVFWRPFCMNQHWERIFANIISNINKIYWKHRKDTIVLFYNNCFSLHKSD